MNEPDLRERLEAVEIRHDAEAEERSWRVVRTALESRVPEQPQRPVVRRLALGLAVVGALIVAALTPPGEAVGDFLEKVISQREVPAKPALESLPAAGRLLVNSREGAWVVNRDGSKRLLGPYDDAAWSPQGRFVVAAQEQQLVAMEPDGDVRWSLARPTAIGDPRWSPSGFRIAYRSGSSVRVVAGDGTGDRRLVGSASRTPTAWRPSALEHVLAYADRDGQISAIDTDSGKVRWRTPRGAVPQQLQWSADGRRLLAVGDSSLRLYDRNGKLVRESSMSDGSRIEAAAFAPNGQRIAVSQRTPDAELSQVVVMELGANRRDTQVFAGLGGFSDLAWSPDGAWLLIAWRDADQWVFAKPKDPDKVSAVSDISRQFDPGASGQPAFPSVGKWCCGP